MICYGCIDEKLLSSIPESVFSVSIILDVVGSFSLEDLIHGSTPYCVLCNRNKDLGLAVYIPLVADIKYPMFKPKNGMIYFYIFCVCKDHEIALGSSDATGLPKVLTTVPNILRKKLVDFLTKERKNVLCRLTSTADKRVS